MERSKMKGNVILIDADYVDCVAAELTAGFQDMLFRSLPKADLAAWLVCSALDGDIPEGDNEIQTIFIHTPEKEAMEYFEPGIMKKELDGLAFRDPIVGEFLMSSIPDTGNIMFDTPLMVQCVEAVLESKDVKRVVIVPEMTNGGDKILELIDKHKDKQVTLLTMEPIQQEGINHALLGYGIMYAMGIKGDEL